MKVEPIPDCGVPMTCVQEAKKKKVELAVQSRGHAKKGRKTESGMKRGKDTDSLSARDEVWVVCDVDDHPRVDDARIARATTASASRSPTLASSCGPCSTWPVRPPISIVMPPRSV